MSDDIQEQEEVQEPVQMQQWDPVMLSLVVEKRSGAISFSQQGLRSKGDVKMLIFALQRAQSLATDLLIQMTEQDNDTTPEPDGDEQEA